MSVDNILLKLTEEFESQAQQDFILSSDTIRKLVSDMERGYRSELYNPQTGRLRPGVTMSIIEREIVKRIKESLVGIFTETKFY